MTTCVLHCSTQTLRSLLSTRSKSPASPSISTPAVTRRSVPTWMHGGVKANVIPDEVEIELDIRTLPGETQADVEAHLAEALGDLAGAVEVEIIHADESTASPIDTPMWETLGRLMQKAHPGAELLPSLIVGGTDARFFREKRHRFLRRRAVQLEGHLR